MKHFFNRRESIVTEAIDGLLCLSGGALTRLDGYPDIKVVIRDGWDQSKVALISGGGAGHEPSHAGFVGEGMLTAAVSGEIFASPSSEAVLAAIRAVTGRAGCLLIVKNYTGDRLNFGLAAEKARREGYQVEMVIVADDIALPHLAQPRGIAGSLFVHKIAGYLSESGGDLATIASAARVVAEDTFSLGMSLSSCSIPGQPHEDRLSSNEAELGLGIHGEPGVERISVQSATKLLDMMVAKLSARVVAGYRYAVLINNLGAVPPLEMALIANGIRTSSLGDKLALAIGPAHLMTALNMNGFSLSLLALNDARVAALCAPVSPHAWPPAKLIAQPKLIALPKPAASNDAIAASPNADAEAIIRIVCERLIGIEAELNSLDAQVGDGDTGTTVAIGARAVLARLGQLPLTDTSATLAAIAGTLSKSMGGSSGVLLSIFFTAASKAIGDGSTLPGALLAGLDRMAFYGGGQPGDRTMIDALAPALATLEHSGIEAAAVAARQGAASTAAMSKARAGRSAYLGDGAVLGVIDPGAFAVAQAFAALFPVMPATPALSPGSHSAKTAIRND